MRDQTTSMLQEVLPPDERVIEAVVARYQRVAPAVTRFARSLAGNEDLVVRLGSQASGGKDEIIIDPGVFQAAYARSAPVTPAEVALTSALHEVVHLVATDFEEKRPLPRGWAGDRTGDQTPRRQDADGATAASEDSVLLFEDIYVDESEDEIADMVDSQVVEPIEEVTITPDPATPISLLDALEEAGGPSAITMFLALEDARQELRFFSPYPGARSVLSDLYRAAVPDAMRQAGALSQFGLACFLVAGGYHDRAELQPRLAPNVVAAIDDAMAFINDLSDLEDPWEVGSRALDLLEVARLHRLLTETGSGANKRAEKLGTEIDQAALAEGIDAVRIVTPPLQDRDSYEQTRDAAQAVSAEHGRMGEVDQAGDPGTDQLVKVSSSPTVYLPTGQGGKLVVADFPDEFRNFGPEGRAMLAQAADRWNVAQRRVSGALYPLFLANQRRGLRSGFDAGDLSPYAALLLGAGLYERMFERRDLPTRRSYGVSLLVDGSASMLQPRLTEQGRKAPWALAAATLGAWTLARLADELQIDFEVALFNRAFVAAGDDSEESFSERRHRATGALRRSQGGAAERLTRTVNHYIVKSFDARWRAAEDVMAGLFYMAAAPGDAAKTCRLDPASSPPISMFDKAANVDEFNVVYAAQRLASRHVQNRILVVLADGMTRGSVQDLADSVAAVEQSGAVILGIGIGDETVQAAYSRNQVVERPEELARAMVQGVQSTLYETIAGMGGNTWWSHSSEQVTQQREPTPRSVNA